MFNWLLGKGVPRKHTLPVIKWAKHPRWGRLAVLAETSDVSKKWLMAVCVDDDGEVITIWSKDLQFIDPQTGEPVNAAESSDSDEGSPAR
jgi:hypothetical protein